MTSTAAKNLMGSCSVFHKPELQLDKIYESLGFIWPHHEKLNPDWDYVSRRLYDLYFILYRAECTNQKFMNHLGWLSNIATIRGGMG